jgi:hypothetical protein
MVEHPGQNVSQRRKGLPTSSRRGRDRHQEQRTTSRALEHAVLASCIVVAHDIAIHVLHPTGTVFLHLSSPSVYGSLSCGSNVSSVSSGHFTTKMAVLVLAVPWWMLSVLCVVTGWFAAATSGTTARQPCCHSRSCARAAPSFPCSVPLPGATRLPLWF